MQLSISLKDSLDGNPVYTFPRQCAKSIRRSFLRTGRAMSLSLQRKPSKRPTNSAKVNATCRRSSTNSTLSTSSTSSDSHGTGSYPVSSASSSFTQLSDLTATSLPYESITAPQPPTNHPPKQVFSMADQGYSMFYLKLPNGNWMVRCRTADRKIIATYEVDGSMI